MSIWSEDIECRYASYRSAFAEWKGVSGVYLIIFADGCKFGKSSNLSGRINDYLRPYFKTVFAIKAWKFQREDLLEKEVLAKIPESKRKGEFVYGLTVDEVSTMVSGIREELHRVCRK